MRKLILICGLAALALVCLTGWRIGSSELANLELRDDMKDLCSRAGMRIGLSSPTSDEQLRMAVVAKLGNTTSS